MRPGSNPALSARYRAALPKVVRTAAPWWRDSNPRHRAPLSDARRASYGATYGATYAPFGRLEPARGDGWWIGSLSRRLQQGIWMGPLFNRRAREPVLPRARVGAARRNVRVRRAGDRAVHVLNLEASLDVHLRCISESSTSIPSSARAAADGCASSK